LPDTCRPYCTCCKPPLTEVRHTDLLPLSGSALHLLFSPHFSFLLQKAITTYKNIFFTAHQAPPTSRPGMKEISTTGLQVPVPCTAPIGTRGTVPCTTLPGTRGTRTTEKSDTWHHPLGGKIILTIRQIGAQQLLHKQLLSCWFSVPDLYDFEYY
jgi:hypothetical protein